MRCAIIGFVVGVCLLQIQSVLPPPSTVWLLIALAITSGLLSRVAHRLLFKCACLLGCGTLLGFVWAAQFAQYYLTKELPNEWEGRDVTVVGTIDSLPYRFEQGVRFNFA